jgi:hypothetical protein
MAAQSPRRFAQLLLAGWALVACHSGPQLTRAVTIHEGERTVVRLHSGASLMLTLENASAVTSTTVYGTARSPDELGRKVVADADLQALLDVFAERGMFAQALAEPPRDARDLLIVDSGGRRWQWARRQPGVQAAEQDFHEARAYFLSLYNSSVAFHGTDASRPNFTGEQVRASTAAASARARLEELRRGQR